MNYFDTPLDLQDAWLQDCIEIQLGITEDSIPTVQQLEEMDRLWAEIDESGTYDFTFLTTEQ
jgi:hypothetical protein